MQKPRSVRLGPQGAAYSGRVTQTGGCIDDEIESLLDDQMLTAPEVARILKVRPKRVYELCIPAVRLSDRTLRWRLSAVRRWIEEREAA